MDGKLPLQSFASVGQNQTAVVSLEVGPTYDEIHFEYNYDATGGDEFDMSHFTGIRLNLNGTDIVDVKGSDLILLEGYEGQSGSNGYFTLSLRELIARSFDGENLTGLVTQLGDSISIEIDIANAKAISGDPSLKGFAVTSPARNVRSIVPTLKRFSFANSATGPFEITSLPKGPHIKRMHFLSANMNGLKVYRNNFKHYDLSLARTNYLSSRNGRVAQANTFTFDPISDGWVLAKMFATAGAQSLIYECEMTGTGSVPVLVEGVEGDLKPTAPSSLPRGRNKRRR